MRKEIITAIDRDGIEVRIHSLVFNIYKEKINLIDTIKGAVASYINSGYGFREYENNCYNFNWGDLLLIPNSFLRQFGIERESETEITEVDFNEQLFSANDLNFTEEKWETLKRKLFMHGRKALEDYLDTDTETSIKIPLKTCWIRFRNRCPTRNHSDITLNTVWTQITPLKPRKT